MDTLHDLNKLYNKQKYLDRYGSSVVMSIIIILIFSTVSTYFVILNNVQPIRADWVNQRCKPTIMPFAGIINPPNDGSSPFEYTEKNYNQCMQNIIKEAGSTALKPLEGLLKLIHNFMIAIAKVINLMRELFNKIREGAKKILVNVMHRILGILIPVQEMMIAVKDLLLKTKGIMTASLFTGLGGYMTIKAALGSIYELIVAILVALGAMIVLLWILPFTWSTAALATTAMIAISIPMGIFATFLGDVFKQAGAPVPPAPSCFSGDTKINVKNANSVKIKDLIPGMVLEDGSLVTSKFKLSSKHEKMYNLNGIVVSGSHRVKHNYQWIKVANHPMSYLIPDFKVQTIYCLNTTSKTIKINDMIFSDWDDKTDEEIKSLNKAYSKYNISNITKKNMHILNIGYVKQTPIELVDKSTKPINEINVGDILSNDEVVLGIVEFNPVNSNYYSLKTNKENIILASNYETVNIHFPNATKIKNHFETKVYHLLTDTKSFYINGIKFHDFENNIDSIIYKKNIN